MGEKQSGVHAKYEYIHDQESSPSLLDAHHVEVRRSGEKAVAACLFAALVSANAFFAFYSKEKPNILPIWGFPLGALLMMKLCRRTVKKESVLIMPTFGVQLETHYRSGRIIRRFVPMGKILKPVLQESVTPVTCYWCLSLILRDEEQLMLVFKELRPPLKMLIPIWKAICAAADKGGGLEQCGPDG